jgi:Mrp family chromosome partitioning ATPase/uncharacterized protein involved in exopolysaccharide biosynthesis
MASLSNESTPRERLARIITLMKRTRMFWRSAVAIAALGLAISLAVALRSKRAFRSETTVLYRDGIQTTATETESAAARAARLGPKLKDLLYARPKLERVIREFDLFPEKSRRSMLDGIEEMQAAVGFRARASDSYVISFTYEDPVTAQRVTARLAALMIEAYNRQNLDTATLTRDFLRRKLEEAGSQMNAANHALATFLAQHPQFQWGVNDSPYAPSPGPSSLPLPGRAPAALSPQAPGDATLGLLERELARVELALAPPAAGRGPAPVIRATPSEAQKQRDAAAAALAAAEAALAEKLHTVKPAHPDAVSAEAHVAAARQSLAAAEAALAAARAGLAAPGPEREDLSPARRTELERQRAALRRQLAERRSRLGAGEAPGPSPRPAGTAKSASSDVVELETEWHRLRLDLERAKDQLHTLQTNARAAEISADAVARQGHEEMQILEPAYVPLRPDRGRGRVFFISATIALFFAVGYAAARVLLNDTLLDEGDVAALGGPPVLVAMPRLPVPPAPPPERAIVPVVRCDEDPDDDDLGEPTAVVTPPPAPAEVPLEGACPAEAAPASIRSLALRVGPIVEAVFEDPEVEVIGADVGLAGQGAGAFLREASPEALASLRVLRHRLEQRRGDGSFVVSVMSPGAGEGKTTLALRLALTLSEAERARVILVEGNFERPRVAAALGLRLPDEAGFSAQLKKRMSGRGIAWGVVRLGPSLSLLAEPGRAAAHPQAIHSTHFEGALTALRRSFEYVVIDGPAIVGSGDANVIETVSDGALIVVRVGSTAGGALSRATQQLGDRRVLGVVLNDVAPRAVARISASR